MFRRKREENKGEFASGQQPMPNSGGMAEIPPMGPGIGPPGMMRGRDWTQGSILKNLMLLSWPIAITNTLMMLGPTIDMVWVGKLGSGSIAGVGVAGVAVQLVMGAMMGLTAGMRALIARFVGAKDIDSANHVAQQASVVTAWVVSGDKVLTFGCRPLINADHSERLQAMRDGFERVESNVRPSRH